MNRENPRSVYKYREQNPKIRFILKWIHLQKIFQSYLKTVGKIKYVEFFWLQQNKSSMKYAEREKQIQSDVEDWELFKAKAWTDWTEEFGIP